MSTEARSGPSASSVDPDSHLARVLDTLDWKLLLFNLDLISLARGECGSGLLAWSSLHSIVDPQLENNTCITIVTISSLSWGFLSPSIPNWVLR